MLIAYLTTDEVNLDMAHTMAEEGNAFLYPLSFGEEVPEGHFDAMIYDVDYLPPSQRRELLDELQAGPAACPVVVHSYHLDKAEEKALRLNGVAVYRRLEPEVFRLLTRQPAGYRAVAGFRKGAVAQRYALAGQRATG